MTPVRTTEAERAPGIMSAVSSEDERSPHRARRLSIPLVPALAAVLVLLLAAVAVLWFTRPQGSSIETEGYVAALQAARSNIVDLTSYDYLTLDDDIEQARRVTTGELRDESVAKLDDQRKAIADSRTVVNTEVIDAGVTRVTDDAATALMMLQATQSAEGSEKSQVVRYRVEVDLVKRDDGHWVLSGIRGR
jgi:Mce-associated membrane protein